MFPDVGKETLRMLFVVVTDYRGLLGDMNQPGRQRVKYPGSRRTFLRKLTFRQNRVVYYLFATTSIMNGDIGRLASEHCNRDNPIHTTPQK